VEPFYLENAGLEESFYLEMLDWRNPFYLENAGLEESFYLGNAGHEEPWRNPFNLKMLDWRNLLS
jgi:hypothetical protein